MNEREHYLWVEKYRPTTLDSYIGNPHFKDKMAGYIAEQDIPHLLLFGPAGTGKTTAAKIVTNSVECDCLFLNASDENNVDMVRTKIKSFASSMSFKPLKVIVLDESDFLTAQSQAALRNMMEVFSKSTRFILTANYQERIIEPIVSRTQAFEIIPPSKAEVARHVSKILEAEGVSYTVPDLGVILNAFYPDIRRVVNELQSYTKNGKLSVEQKKIAEADYKTKLLSILKTAASPTDTVVNELRQVIADSRVRDFAPLYRFLYDQITEIAHASTAIPEIILAIAEGVYKDSLVVDKEINVMATLIRILQVR